MPEWIDSQMRVLLESRPFAVDAYLVLRWIMDHLPTGADPQTWTPTADQLMTALDAADISDARAAWYTDRPTFAKRLLDARVEQ